jgi:hypothetical protein
LIDRSAHVGNSTKNVLLHLFFEVKGPLLQQTSEIGNGRSSIRKVKDKGQSPWPRSLTAVLEVGDGRWSEGLRDTLLPILSTVLIK